MDIEDKKVESIARAFWRRIEPFKNGHDKELPLTLPVEFRAHMGTALSILDDDSGPLNAASSNVLIHRLGRSCRDASEAPAGDFIDTGLTLLRLLNEAGFEIREKQ